MFDNERLEMLDDPRERVDFWVAALRTEGLSSETRRLMDKCLQAELRGMIEPPERIAIGKQPDPEK